METEIEKQKQILEIMKKYKISAKDADFLLFIYGNDESVLQREIARLKGKLPRFSDTL